MTKVCKRDKENGWRDEGKEESLMCVFLVRSDSNQGRERKVKEKVTIIYLITDPSDTTHTHIYPLNVPSE